MKVFVLSADTITDVAGEIIDSSYIVDVFTSSKAANAALEDIAATGATGIRLKWEYNIKEFEVKS